MDKKAVCQLNGELENAIADVVSRMGLRKFPLLPSQETIRQMAKAAVVVYEAALENQQSGENMTTEDSTWWP